MITAEVAYGAFAGAVVVHGIVIYYKLGSVEARIKWIETMLMRLLNQVDYERDPGKESWEG